MTTFTTSRIHRMPPSDEQLETLDRLLAEHPRNQNLALKKYGYYLYHYYHSKGYFPNRDQVQLALFQKPSYVFGYRLVKAFRQSPGMTCIKSALVVFVLLFWPQIWRLVF